MTVVETRSGHADARAWEVGPLSAGETRSRMRISGRRVVALVLPGLILLDAVLVSGSFWLAMQLFGWGRPGGPSQPSEVRPQLIALFSVLVLSFLVLGGMFGLYSRRSLLHPSRAMRAAARAIMWSGIVAVVFAFLLALDPPGDFRWLLVKHALLLAAGVMVLRPLACRGLLRLTEVGPVAPRRVLVLGDAPEARRVASVLEQSSSEDTLVVGFASPSESRQAGGRRWPHFRLDSWTDAVRLADDLAADEVLVCTPRVPRAEAVGLSFALASAGVQLQVMPRMCEMFVEGTPTHRDCGVPLARLGCCRIRGWESALKRATDITLTLAGGLVLLPLLAAIALAVKLTSRGPVLYAQTRVGRSGRPFRMFKFRSMKDCNDDSDHRTYIAMLMKQGYAAGWDAAGRPVYKLIDDPRVTAVGRFIRATSLDELPQLINVLRGEMSLVGPRPCLPFEYELYENWHRARLESTTPGMTGLWQVSGRSLLTFEEMVLLDLFYTANWTFPLDLRILWSTIPEVIFPGAGR